MDKIEELITRGVDTIYPSKEEFEKVLRGGKKLRLYQGFDPTGVQLHVGHLVGLRKLAEFQKLGHHVIFLIGDGTGLAGDPSGKTRGREKFLSRDELRKNAVDYVKQAEKIVSFKSDNPVEILFNGDWLTKLTLVDLLEIAGNFTWQQLSDRDMFVDRAKRGEPINMREFLYPLLQGYDSVAMQVDLEIGGTDQMFNMLAGRTLVENMLHKNKFVMTTPLLTDSEGRKIGKTEGNVIAINDTPADLYGKLMGLSDGVIVKAFEYLTDVAMSEIREIEQKLAQGENPLTFKKRLAYEIVKQLNVKGAAASAQEMFEKTVQQKELPKDIPTIQFSQKEEGISLVDALFEFGLAESKSEAKRLIEQGGVSIDSQVTTDPLVGFVPEDGAVLKVGKRKYLRIKLN